MSGAEVGLLLAIIPILVNAAEHYKRVHRPLRAVIHRSDAEEKLADFYQDLHFEVNFLDITINNLVRDLPTLSEFQAQDLGNFRNRNIWESPEVTQALKDRLGPSYTSFSATVQATLRVLDNILSGQNIDTLRRHGVVPDESEDYGKLTALRRNLSHGDNTSSLLQRVRFSTREEKRKRSLKRLTKNNQNLERLLSQTQEPLSTRSSSQKMAPKRQFWKFLHGLYDAMVRQLSCGCSTYHQGRVDLVKSLQSSLSESDTTVDFDVFLSRRPLDDCKTVRWQDSTISINLDSLTMPRLCVSFADDGDEDDDGATRRRADSVIEPRSPELSEDAVDDICRLMEMACANRCKLRMRYNSGQLFHAQPQRQHRGVGAAISLGELLRSKKKVTLKQRRILAVILAHSMLQYHGSPWLSHDWSKEKVEFFCDQDATLINVQRPYMSTNFMDSSPKAVASNYALHPYPDVLALGIMLLEIQLEDTIESKREPEDLCDGRVNVNTDLFTAHRILKDSCDDIYGSYFAAIAACVDHSRFLDKSVDEDQFRQALYSNIVVPLEEELKTGFKVSVDHVWETGYNSFGMQAVAARMSPLGI